jgi:sporulation protein YlmC with PRC-barrel domain
MRKLILGGAPALGLVMLAGVAAAQSGPTTGSGVTATQGTAPAAANPGPVVNPDAMPGNQAATGTTTPAAPNATPATPNDTSAGAASTMNAATGNTGASTTAGNANPAPPATGAASGTMSDNYKSYSAAGKDFPGSVAGGYSAKDLMGKNIVGPDGKQIAEVADLVIDPDNSIKRVIVDVGGFLGIGAKPVAIDIDQLQKPADGKGDLRINMTKDQLNALPHYTRDDKGNYVPQSDNAKGGSG